MKTQERAEARRMRAEEGRSMKEIASLLGVSCSSVSLWVRDIELTKEQHEALLARNPRYHAQHRAKIVRSERARLRRRRYQLEGRRRARKPEPLFLAGCMLYWAEGSRDRNRVVFVNSDPAMAVLFIRFLRDCFAVDSDEITIYCNLFPDHERRRIEIEDFWLRRLGLPRSSLRKSVINRYSKYSKKKRTNALPYGTCRLVVHSTEVVQTIYGSIQGFANFNRPEWLDC